MRIFQTPPRRETLDFISNSKEAENREHQGSPEGVDGIDGRRERMTD